MVSNRDIRRVINTKQDSLQSSNNLSINSMVDGQIGISTKVGEALSLVVKRGGRIWKSYLSSDGNDIVDKNLSIGGNLNVVGNISGSQVSFFNHNYNAANSNKNYVPWGSISESGSINFYNNIIAPYAGKLLKVLVRCEEDIDTVAVGFHKSPDGTEAPNATATETITLEMGTEDTTTEFNFTPTSVFDKGDVIAISIDPENTANDVKVTSAWLFNILI